MSWATSIPWTNPWHPCKGFCWSSIASLEERECVGAAMLAEGGILWKRRNLVISFPDFHIFYHQQRKKSHPEPCQQHIVYKGPYSKYHLYYTISYGWVWDPKIIQTSKRDIWMPSTWGKRCQRLAWVLKQDESFSLLAVKLTYFKSMAIYWNTSES